MEQRCLSSLQRLWIVEYVWAHNMMDVLQDVEGFSWPDGDWKSLNLDESWRIRVASAQVYCIIRKRQTCQYEKVMAFLECIYSLLPTLVPSIKHMKIMFGLKTMVIMWMLKESTGLIDVVYKIIQFFPSKLPQYQEHCSKHEMFLIRKNQLDFKAFAQSLAMDKQKLQNYIQNHMDEQYGEHYAQKTEERLLHYLRELDKYLPEDTYIDKILKKNSPVNEEEKLLLELVPDDSTPIASTLKTLLNCDSASCYSSKQRTQMGSCLGPESACAGPSKDDLQTTPDVPKVSLKDCTKKQANNMNIKESPKSSPHEGKLSPYFCSKHQRWVKNILYECPMESSEEQQVQDNEISPPLFPSNTSSDDLTPSDLTPSGLTLPPDQHQSALNPSESKDKPEEPKLVDKPSCEPVDLGPPSNPAPSPVQSSKSTGAVLKVVLVPLKDLLKTNATSHTDHPTSSNQNPAKTSSAFSHLTVSTSLPMHQMQTSSKQTFSRLSRKYRQAKSYSQTQDMDSEIYKVSEKVQVSPQISSALLEIATSFSKHDTFNNTPRFTHSQPHSKEASDPTLKNLTLDHMARSNGSTQPHLSLQSKSLQPCVALKRLTIEECLQVTKGRSYPRQYDNMDLSNQADSSFDVNYLYSSSSSYEEADDSDPEYRPAKKTLFRWSLACDH